MKFLIDAQLPQRLARELAAAGHDVVHTLDLPAGNRTPDEEILKVAARDSRSVVTKDSDFVASFLLRGAPPKLLLVSTGNIDNDALARLIAVNLKGLETVLAKPAFVELSVAAILIHV